MSRDVAQVTERVRAFYESYPFPDYEGFESPQDLMVNARRGVYPKMLDDELPLGVRVLDAGCGTGQLAIFLSLAHRAVIGADLSFGSLTEGRRFRERFGLTGVSFIQMDVFAPSFRAGSFDFVLCNGVLHHTAAPERAFAELCGLLKPGGYIVLGLYNRFGRLRHKVRQKLAQVGGRGEARWPKPMGDRKRRAWLLDQYEHPHESCLSVDTVLAWFQTRRIEYVNSVPPIDPSMAQKSDSRLFAQRAAGSRFMHLMAQAAWIFTLDREGGYFVTIGRKRS